MMSDDAPTDESNGAGGPRDDASGDAQLFADLAQTMHDSTSTIDSALEMVFEQAATLHPDGGEHASITVRRRRNGYESLGASSPLAAKVDQLQYDLGEGPCIDAASPQGEDWYRSGDLGHEPRWPQWGSAAADMGISSVLAVQLLRNSEHFGAINIYGEQPDQFKDSHEVDRVLLWAIHAATALSAAWTEAGLNTAISARHGIGVAQGILMQALDLDLDSAFKFMTRVASHRERRLHDIADEIVRTRQIPQID